MVANLRYLREQFGLTQAQLGAAIGVCQQSIQKYEIGSTEPDIVTLCALADFFSTTVDYLVGRSPSPVLREGEPLDVLTDEDVSLVCRFSRLSSDMKRSILNVINIYINTADPVYLKPLRTTMAHRRDRKGKRKPKAAQKSEQRQTPEQALDLQTDLNSLLTPVLPPEPLPEELTAEATEPNDVLTPEFPPDPLPDETAEQATEPNDVLTPEFLPESLPEELTEEATEPDNDMKPDLNPEPSGAPNPEES